MSSDRDDPLAHTATAPSAPASPAAEDLAASLTAGAMVGRYRIERELGTGGMGVVYLAYDPDLERRVALKVLRTQGDLAAKRLLREARAMARLSHPNVVTVHEVGSAGGRDFVAMELVEGASLHEWLRTGTRAPEDVVAAFVAAGRGLAAAHAAGIVHRDFKPHNVLRSHAGRICVTDFGLARSADADGGSDPLAETQPITDTTSTPSSLAGLTHTGSVLGTPAYMAPEQWRGATVSPATDQFAFCVAMWEALVGARPFLGPTLEALRAQVEAGPTEEGLATLPRTLRPVLARGLEPDPARRWPSMDALLAALTPRRSRRWIPIAVIAALGVTGGGIAVALSTGDEDASVCAAPAIEPSAIALDRDTRARQVGSAALIDADLARWRTARATACGADPLLRPAQLACLDGTMGRLALAARIATSHEGGTTDVGEILVDPAVCVRPRPPVIVAPGPAFADVASMASRPSRQRTRAELDALVTRTKSDPCAHGLAHLLSAWDAKDLVARRTHREQIDVAVDRCEDERTRADLALGLAGLTQLGDRGGPPSVLAVSRAETYVARVAQADLVAKLEALRLQSDVRAGDGDGAVRRIDAVLDGFRARGRYAELVDAGLELDSLRTMRGREEDLETAKRHLGEWRTLIRDRLGGDPRLMRDLERIEAVYQFSAGDVAGSHARLLELREERPLTDPVRVRGIVVDPQGSPVAGAAVWAGTRFAGTEAGVVFAFQEGKETLRTATTGADGRFEIEAPAGGTVVAERGALRSIAAPVADEVQLRVAPTSRVEGRVDLGAVAPWRVSIAVASDAQPLEASYVVIAPVRPDGTFSIGGVPRGAVSINTVTTTMMGVQLGGSKLVVDEPVVGGVRLSVPVAARTAHLVLRSTVGLPLANAQAILVEGARTPANVRELLAVAGTTQTVFARRVDEPATPASVRAASAPDDLYATFPQAPAGEVTVCVLPLPQDLSDPTLQQRIERNYDRLPLACAPLPDDDRVIRIDVPPWPRLD